MEHRSHRGPKRDHIRDRIKVIESANAGDISVITSPMFTKTTASSQRRLNPVPQTNLDPDMNASAPTLAKVISMMNHKLSDNVTPGESKKNEENALGTIEQSGVKGDRDQTVEKPKRRSASATSTRSSRSSRSRSAARSQSKTCNRKGSVRVREFDYDTHPTKLIKMVEKKKWEEVIQRCADNPREVSSWMCRSQEVDGVDGKKKKEVRWRILPLHSAIAQHAPLEVIKALVAAYPDSVKKGDDKRMLPLHMAFRSGASLETAAFLYDANTDATSIKDSKGHTPLHVLKAYRRKYEMEKDNDKVSSTIIDNNRKDLIKTYLGNRVNRKRTGSKKKKHDGTVTQKLPFHKQASFIQKTEDGGIAEAKLPLYKQTSQSQKNEDGGTPEVKLPLYKQASLIQKTEDGGIAEAKLPLYKQTSQSQKNEDGGTPEVKLPLYKQASQSLKNEDKVKVETKSPLYNDDDTVESELPSYDSDSSFYDSSDNDSEDEYANQLINYGKAALDGFLHIPFAVRDSMSCR